MTLTSKTVGVATLSPSPAPNKWTLRSERPDIHLRSSHLSEAGPSRRHPQFRLWLTVSRTISSYQSLEYRDFRLLIFVPRRVNRRRLQTTGLFGSSSAHPRRRRRRRRARSSSPRRHGRWDMIIIIIIIKWGPCIFMKFQFNFDKN